MRRMSPVPQGPTGLSRDASCIRSLWPLAYPRSSETPPRLLSELPDHAQEMLYVERLITHGVRALGNCLFNKLLHFAAITCDHHGTGRRVPVSHHSEHLTTIPLRQLHINEHH